MFTNNGKHLPQIEYYYKGTIYPFIGKLNLKELLIVRNTWLNYKSPILLKKADRDTHKSQLSCIEQCIRILFSEPNPNPSIQLLQKNDKTYKPPICNKSSTKTSQDTALTVFDIIKGYNP